MSEPDDAMSRKQQYSPGERGIPFDVEVRSQPERWISDGFSPSWGVDQRSPWTRIYATTAPADGLAVQMIFEEQHSGYGLMSLQLVTVRPGVEITTKAMRELSLSRLIDQTLPEIRRTLDTVLEDFDKDAEDLLLERWRSAAGERDELAYAGLAYAYVGLLDRGHRKPSEDLAQRLGLSAGTVNQRVREARLMGLLTPAPTGKAGGQLTERARTTLANWIANDGHRKDG